MYEIIGLLQFHAPVVRMAPSSGTYYSNMASFVRSILNLHESRSVTNAALQTLHSKAMNAGEEDLTTLCKQGRLDEAMETLHLMDAQRISLDSSVYESLLQSCVDYRALPEAKLVHAHIILTGFKSSRLFLHNTLVNMYAKCGSLLYARAALDQIPEPNAVSYSLMIAAYAREGHGEEAWILFYQMKRKGIQPDEFTIPSVLRACGIMAELECGREIHGQIIKSNPFQDNIFIGTALVDMYVKCQSLDDARNVFDKMPERNVVSWNAMIAGYAESGDLDKALDLFENMPKRDVVSWNLMIAGYAKNGKSKEALELFYQMQEKGIRKNQFTFTSVLPACADLGELTYGKDIHGEVNKGRLQSNVFVGSALVDMYVKCGSIKDARTVFDEMPEQNVVTWNSIIAGYAQNGQAEEALTLFCEMRKAGICFNEFTFGRVLPACASLGVAGHGKEIHREIITSGCQTDVFVGSALVDMYSKCGSLQNARQIFDKITERDVVIWNTMIAAYSQNGFVEEALKLFQEMPEQDVCSWSGMIAGYVQNGLSEEALQLFDKMPWKGIRPDQYTFASVLKACADLEGLNHGKRIHEEIIKTGYGINVFVGSALVDMYGKCGSIEDAWDVFDKLPNRNVVSWSAMIAVFAQNGHFDGALDSFRQMQLTSVKPNSDIFASVLSACANLAALEHGKEVHERIIKSDFQSEVFVGSALVDMYAKCGNIEDAYKAFERMPTKNNVSWNAMIAGYAIHGYGKQAVELFERMQLLGMKPDDVTFIGILSACCHAGMVEDGLRYFNSMTQYYHIMPMIEHYCCMVDLLGRAGHLDEAKDLIQKMPVEPNATIWMSLLGSCRIYSNIELGEWTTEHLFQLDPKNSAAYVLLSNIYAAAGRWDDVQKVRKMTQDRMVQKEPGYSWIEVNKIVHTFLAGDRPHAQMQEVYAKSNALSGQMKAAGYIANMRFILHDTEEEQKELLATVVRS